MRQNKPNPQMSRPLLYVCFFFLGAIALYGCSNASSANTAGEFPPQSLPVVQVDSATVNTYQEFTASLQGNRDIEVRPQVDGYLDKIYIDEGAHVTKGQPLFHIDAHPYQEVVNNTRASLQAAKAAMESAAINVEKLTPLVQNNVVSAVQLKSAQSAYDAAKANVAQAQAAAASAGINLGYTTIYAQADGYVGRIPFKTGSLVSRTTAEPLTLLSETKEMHAYFSLSETAFLQFKEQFKGNTIEEKIKHLPDVELVQADNSLYPEKGKIEIVEGQFNKSIGAINFRATFPNAAGLLRSGNTGKIRIPNPHEQALVIPQEATYELQDKVFVFVVDSSSKVTGKPVTIKGRSGNYYLVDQGVSKGDQIVYAGLDKLRDGAKIIPRKLPMDSLFKANPL
jgi:membrane fusion protein (multidrug efflux system)